MYGVAVDNRLRLRGCTTTVFVRGGLQGVARVKPGWPGGLLALPAMTSRSLLVLMANAFLTTSSGILFTSGKPAHNWSLIS